ncbi:hypothetical protein C8Q78DRAFT_458236 [Trametes maxima]|nr:hypothetical protein C8Q78DRAFT_458236 [Trametes maxima]
MNSGAAAPLPQPSRVANINDANGDQRTAASARRRVRLRILTQPPNGHRNRDLHHEFARPPTLRPPMTSVSTRYRRPKFPTPRAWPSTDAPASLPSPHAAARPVRTLSALHAIPIHILSYAHSFRLFVVVNAPLSSDHSLTVCAARVSPPSAAAPHTPARPFVVFITNIPRQPVTNNSAHTANSCSLASAFLSPPARSHLSALPSPAA